VCGGGDLHDLADRQSDHALIHLHQAVTWALLDNFDTGLKAAVSFTNGMLTHNFYHVELEGPVRLHSTELDLS
jgi:hypothetical protein